MTEFRISVDGGRDQSFAVPTGLYVSAAAAVPAMLGLEDFPVTVKIWVEDLQPDYPPLYLVIEEAGGAALPLL